MSEAHVRVVARVNVRPEKLQETLDAFTTLVAATRAEDGCISYEVLQNPEDPLDITFVEEWASNEVLDAHFATEHFGAVGARVGELLTAPPDIRRYKVFA